MTINRGTALFAGLTALACTISLAAGLPAASAGTSSTATASGAKTLVVKAASARPPRDATPWAGSYFAFPNRSSSEKTAIRNRVVNAINSTWGRYTVDGTVKRGKILMTTWSFNDQGVRNALVAAAKRGTTVKIIAAQAVNTRENYKPWFSLRKAINSTMRGWSGVDPANTARQCRGACRGGGGTAHSKYFLFDDVGRAHQRHVVMQSSMNLTPFAFRGQWNQATIFKNASIFNHFQAVFNQSLQNKSRGSAAYTRKTFGGVTDIFFPAGTPSRDPVSSMLNRTHCKGATSGDINGRTRVRVINYAIHDTRGNTLAKKLRGLWNKGCDVRIIYSLTSRPVLKILRSRSGRGPIPMRQSVIKNSKGEIVKYNHSKWLAISGWYGSDRSKWTALAGSANWSTIAYHSDEQHQQFFGYSRTKGYFNNFSKTWSQGTSKAPRFGRVAPGVNAVEAQEVQEEAIEDVPEQPTFGEGIYKYMSEGG
jgi:hypothetical protein